MSKSFVSTPTRSDKKPVKKLFDRPVAAEITPESPKTTADNASDKPAKPARTATRVKKLETKTDFDSLIDENKPLNVYGLAMLVLILLILWTGVLIVEQVQDYHAQYTNLQKLKRDHRTLEIEHQRLLIEQQTFSATPQIAKRAVAELNMYYPQLSDRMILQSNPVKTPNDSSGTVPTPASLAKNSEATQ